MTRFRRGLLFCFGLATLWLLVCAVVGVKAAEWVLHPGRKAVSPGMQAEAAAMAKRDEATLANVSISADDGVRLSGWAMRPIHGNGKAVILLHGQADNRAGMLVPAEVLLRHGYLVLLPDSRAQGMSGGEIPTYGIKESGDIRDWFAWLKQTEGAGCVDGLGNSMGAAQVLQSLGTVPGFCAVVAESPYANFRSSSFDRLEERFHVGDRAGRTALWPAVEFGLLYGRWKYGVDLSRVRPDEAVAASHVPVLLIHGQQDTTLLPRNSRTIVERSRGHNANVALWEPREAEHCGAAGAEPEEYERRVVGWFDAHDGAVAGAR